MSRTTWLLDRRMPKFRDGLSRWDAQKLCGLEAPELLGMLEQKFRRYRQRFEEDGGDGLRDRRVGKSSAKKVPQERRVPLLIAQVIRQLGTKGPPNQGFLEPLEQPPFAPTAFPAASTPIVAATTFLRPRRGSRSTN